MRIAVISCYEYRDAWAPCLELIKHFWPDRPSPVVLLTDKHAPNVYDFTYIHQSPSWCEILASYCTVVHEIDPSEALLSVQEDFFINAPVRQDLIDRGLEQMKATGAGCVRLYPCPGGTEEYGDPHFAIVPRGTRYRASCQAAIWEPSYLRRLAENFRTPAEFELEGTKLSDSLPEPVLAWKRDVQPYPINYLCSAIGRGLWSQDAKRLCDSLNIEVDWSRRGFQAA